MNDAAPTPPADIAQPSIAPQPYRAESETRHAADSPLGGRVYELMLNNVLHEVLEKVEERQSRRFAKLVAISSIIMTLVAGGLATYLNAITKENTHAQVSQGFVERMPSAIALLEAKVEARVRNTIDQSFQGQKQDIAASTAFMQFVFLVDSISRRSSFKPSEATHVMAFLRNRSSVEKVIAHAAFPGVLEKVVDSFFSAGMHTEIEELFGRFRDEFLGSKDILLTLVQHYGLQMMGSHDAPHDWGAGTSAAMEAILQKLRSGSVSSPYVALAYKAMLAGAKRIEPEKFARIIMEIDELAPYDKALVCRRLRAHTTIEQLGRRQTATLKRVVERVRAMFETYREPLAKIGCSLG